MKASISSNKSLRKRRPALIDAERARVRSLPAVRLLSNRFALPTATAVVIAESAHFFMGGDR